MWLCWKGGHFIPSSLLSWGCVWWVTERKAAGLWSQITAWELTQLISYPVLAGLHNSWTHPGSPPPKQKNLPALVNVDRPLESLLAPWGIAIIALLPWNSCHGGWHRETMLPSISSVLFPFHQKCSGRQDSHSVFGPDQISALIWKLINFRKMNSEDVIFQAGMRNSITYFYQQKILLPPPFSRPAITNHGVWPLFCFKEDHSDFCFKEHCPGLTHFHILHGRSEVVFLSEGQWLPFY